MGFFAKRLLRAFKLLTSTTTLQETNRKHMCVPSGLVQGLFLRGSHLAGPDVTFRSINHTSAPHPLCAAGLLGAGGGNVPKATAAEATPNSGTPQSPSRLASLLQRSPQGPLLLLCTEAQEVICHCAAPSPPPSRALSLRTSHGKFPHLSE